MYKRKPFEQHVYDDCDNKAYEIFRANCSPFVLPEQHAEDFEIDVILQKLIINGKRKKLGHPIGVELETNARWKYPPKYPFRTVHLIASKVQKYTNYQWQGNTIPTFYLLFSDNFKYCMICMFGRITGDIVTLQTKSGAYPECFVDATMSCIRTIATKDIGEFFYCFAIGQSTKHLWIQTN